MVIDRPPSLILASSSPIRRSMLEQAGVRFTVEPADIDEATVKLVHRAADAATAALAIAKAEAVSGINADSWVIGSDSMVTVDGRLIDKPRGRAEAEDHLRFFAGKPMILTSSAALARGGRSEWCETASAELQVRSYDEAFIQSYLEREWPEAGYCVGVFRLEGLGVNLFERISGDYFTILGMPLLPLLAALRDRGLAQ